MAARHNNADPFEFLSRACVGPAGHTSVPLSEDTGFCLNCPEMYPSVALAQAAANADASAMPGNYTKNRGKRYCGSDPVIKKWTAYFACYGQQGMPHFGFRNPFGYIGLGDPATCFQNGRIIGSSVQTQRRNGGGGGQQQQQQQPFQIPANVQHQVQAQAPAAGGGGHHMQRRSGRH